MSETASPPKPSRQMIYPYTWSAKVAQFPYKYYFKQGWVLKYWLLSVAVCVPIFYKIGTLANSPANKQKWKEIRKEWYSDHGGPH